MTERYSVRDLLAITTKRNISRAGMDGVHEILCWITGDDGLTQVGWCVVQPECSEHLLGLFPELAKAGTEAALVGLDEMLKIYSGNDAVDHWIEKMNRLGKLGLQAEYDVPQLPRVAERLASR